MRELHIRKAEPADALIVGPLVQRAIRARNAADYEPAIIRAGQIPRAGNTSRSAIRLKLTVPMMAPSRMAAAIEALFPVH